MRRCLTYEEKFEMFLALVDKSPHPKGCWIWKGKLTRDGYGIFRSWIFKAHRESYKYWVGPIPEGLWVLHSCDNPSCVNPEHLSAGTPADNMRQKTERGRGNSAKGANHYRTKLTVATALKIYHHPMDTRLHWRDNMKLIADKFGVTSITVYKIRKKQSWKHIHELQTGS